MRIYGDLLYPSLKENAIFVMVDLGAAFVVRLVYGWSIVSTLGLIMLIESAGLMLIGGGIDLAASSSGVKLAGFLRKTPTPSKKELDSAVERAAVFAFTGVILFVESFLLALTVS